jgi:hypothetical protein
MIKRLNEFLNEGKDNNPINYKKLVEYAKGIEICCTGEYGDVYYNESQNHIFVCLGDSNPFDDDSLSSFIKEAVVENYRDFDKVKVTIENECGPSSKEEGWIKVK